MKKYGPPEVLQINEVERPIPQANEILVNIHATTIHTGDVRMRKPDPFLARLVNVLLKPKKIPVLGLELAGEVDGVGKRVKRFKIGDQVFAFSGFTFGAYALQLAKTYGAEVTRECSTKNVEMVASLGAGKVIDYTQEDITQDAERYDVIFDAVDKLSSAQGKKALKKSGLYLNVDKDSGSGGDINTENMNTLKGLREAEKLRIVIDRRYPMAQIVAAHRCVEAGHKLGNVIITVEQEDQSRS